MQKGDRNNPKPQLDHSGLTQKWQFWIWKHLKHSAERTVFVPDYSKVFEIILNTHQSLSDLAFMILVENLLQTY